jgi:lipoate-protein ligase A
MSKSINVVRCRGLSILKQLQAEEVLLRRTKDNWFLMNSHMTDLAIVLGFGGKIHELVDLELVKQSHINGKRVDLIRRYTGGGTVIVDDNTLFASFIMNADDVSTLPYPRDIMDWSEGVYKPVFNGTGNGNHDDGNMVTKAQFSLRENDYILNNLKIGGNAQSITKDRWVHHTSFLWDYSTDNMKYLLMPKKRPDYRRDRPHSEFLDKICNHLPNHTVFEDRTIQELSRHYQVREVSQADALNLVEGLKESHAFAKPPDVRTRIEDV